MAENFRADNYRADNLGSLLRPAKLKEARADFHQGRLSQDALSLVEDDAILAALERQKSIGLDVYSDGEFRRAGFQNDLEGAVDGFVETGQPAVTRIWKGPGEQPEQLGTRHVVGGKLRQVRRLTDTQTGFLSEHAPGPFKMTVPSPNQFPAIVYQPGMSDSGYPTRSDLLTDLVSIIEDEISALIQDDVPYIQLDEPRYSYYVDPNWREHLRGLGEDPDKAFQEALAADNSCLEGAKRDGLTVVIHLCRGNNQSKWYAEGGYKPIAEELFGTLAVDRFLLEYDTERAGTFEPLRFVPRDKMVVLGLVSSKEPKLESQDELLRRIDEASQYFPVDRMALSAQCGFASMAAGNLLTEDEQWRKLELMVETARKVWG